ncbi:hypothetical protein HID58_012092 [Brassica napus]|uniref:Uncharacterized protein n=1 Tax=Brassica napus TaxID=3708 RepID=A0ABQ8E2M7_BRANA|nr:hypothetical protein HID58_012092 [Brassica napus]
MSGKKQVMAAGMVVVAGSHPMIFAVNREVLETYLAWPTLEHILIRDCQIVFLLSLCAAEYGEYDVENSKLEVKNFLIWLLVITPKSLEVPVIDENLRYPGGDLLGVTAQVIDMPLS